MGSPLTQDPFYLVRQDIQDTANELQHKMSRFHGLTSSNPERKQIAAAVKDGCESLKWQLTELDKAVARAADDPQRFGLTPEEVGSRQKWIATTRRQVAGTLDTLATATAAPVNAAEAKTIKANEGFLGDERSKQQLVLKEQDSQLDDIEQAVTRLGRVGLAIHEELDTQGRMLDELEEDVDTTSSRLKAAQKKVADVLRRSGTTTQLALIAFLVVVLIVVAVFAFM